MYANGRLTKWLGPARRFRARSNRRVLQIAAARPTRVHDNSTAETSTLPAASSCAFIC